MLVAVCVRGYALDISRLTQCNYDLLMRLEFRAADVVGVKADVRLAVFAELLAEIASFLLNLTQNLLLVAEKLFESAYRLLDLRVFLFEALTLKGGDAPQLHVQYRLRLRLVKAEPRHQRVSRGGRIGSAAYQRDNLVKVANRNSQTREDVSALPRPLQLEFRAPAHNIPPEVDE